MGKMYVLAYEVTSLIIRLTSNIFFEDSVKFLAQADHKLPNHLTNLVTALVVITKELFVGLWINNVL